MKFKDKSLGIALGVALLVAIMTVVGCTSSNASADSGSATPSSESTASERVGANVAKNASGSNWGETLDGLLGGLYDRYDNTVEGLSRDASSSTSDDPYIWYDSSSGSASNVVSGQTTVIFATVQSAVKNGNGALHAATMDYIFSGEGDAWTYYSEGNSPYSRPKLVVGERVALKVYVGKDSAGNDSRRVLAWANTMHV